MVLLGSGDLERILTSGGSLPGLTGLTCGTFYLVAIAGRRGELVRYLCTEYLLD